MKIKIKPSTYKLHHQSIILSFSAELDKLLEIDPVLALWSGIEQRLSDFLDIDLLFHFFCQF